MSDIDFDANYKLLGVPPAEQAPKKYRLLGVTILNRSLRSLRLRFSGKSRMFGPAVWGSLAERFQELFSELVIAWGRRRDTVLA
ncbi:MAG: hypothetical protein VYA84_09660 [Planctomycetota bacterium]|nr:hypothetical protein [Planctomycetota bacterium]